MTTSDSWCRSYLVSNNLLLLFFQDYYYLSFVFRFFYLKIQLNFLIENIGLKWLRISVVASCLRNFNFYLLNQNTYISAPVFHRYFTLTCVDMNYRVSNGSSRCFKQNVPILLLKSHVLISPLVFQHLVIKWKKFLLNDRMPIICSIHTGVSLDPILQTD